MKLHKAASRAGGADLSASGPPEHSDSSGTVEGAAAAGSLANLKMPSDSAAQFVAAALVEPPPFSSAAPEAGSLLGLGHSAHGSDSLDGSAFALASSVSKSSLKRSNSRVHRDTAASLHAAASAAAIVSDEGPFGAKLQRSVSSSSGRRRSDASSSDVTPAAAATEFQQLQLDLVLSAKELARRLSAAIDTAIDCVDTMAGERGGSSGSSSSSSGSVSAALHSLQTLSALLLSCKTSPAAASASASGFSSSSSAPMSLVATAVPFETMSSLVQALTRVQEWAGAVTGLLHRPDADVEGSKRDVQLVLCGLEAALCTVYVITSPGVDYRLRSEGALSSLFLLLKGQLLQHVLPCFDPLDAAWGTAAAAPSKATTSAAAAAVPARRASSSGPKPRRGSSSSKRGPKVGWEGDDGFDEDMEEDDVGEEEYEASEGASSRRTAGAAASAADGPAARVTKAMITTAQARMRPLILVLAEVLRRAADLVPAVSLVDELLTPLVDVCMLAATQANSHVAGHASSSTAKAHSSATAGTSTAGAESALQLAGMRCLQALFEKYPAQRSGILRELLAVHVRNTGGKRAKLGFAVALSVPRSHLAQQQLQGSTGSSSSAAAAAGPSAASAAASEPRITTFTALLCYLLHSAAALPSESETAPAALASTPSSAASASSGTSPATAAASTASADGKKPKQWKAKKASAAAVDVPVAAATVAVEEEGPSRKKKGAATAATAGKKRSSAAAAAPPQPAAAAVVADEEHGKRKKARLTKTVSSSSSASAITIVDDEDAAPPASTAAPAAKGSKKPLKQATSGAAARAKQSGAKGEAAAPAAETSPASLPPAPVPRPPTSKGFVEPLRLGASYVAQLLGWCGRKLSGDATGLLTGGGSPMDEEADPKLVLRRFVEDLLSVFDLPEWPAAETLLFHAVRMLLDVTASAAAGGAAGSASASSCASVVVSPSADRALASPSISLLGSILTRLQQCRSFAVEHALDLPPEGSAPEDIAQEGIPMKDGEVLGCACGFVEQDGSFMLDCDMCHRWFHGACVGVSAAEDTSKKWFCDACELQAMVDEQRRRLHFRTAHSAVSGALGDAADAMAEEGPLATPITAATPSSPAGIGAMAPLQILRQLNLNFMTDRAHDDAFAVMARRFVVARWASDAWSKRDESTRLVVSEQWDMPTRAVATSRRPPMLTPYGTLRCSLQVLSREPLLALFDDFLRRLLGAFDAGEGGGSKLRATLMKAVADIVRVAPSTLSHPGVARVVAARLRDESKLVRAEALELVGRYVTAAPGLLTPVFFDALLEKLGDEGVSVRKKVVAVFKELLARRMLSGGCDATAAAAGGSISSAAPAALGSLVVPAELTSPLLLRGGGAGSQTSRVLLTLLRAASDDREEASVRDAVRDVFESLWFAHRSPSTSSSSAASPTPTPTAAAAAGSNVASGEAWRPNYSVGSNGTTYMRPNARSAGGRAAREGDAAQSALKIGELQSRAMQIVSLVSLGGTGPSGTKWLSDMLARILDAAGDGAMASAIAAAAAAGGGASASVSTTLKTPAAAAAGSRGGGKSSAHSGGGGGSGSSSTSSSSSSSGGVGGLPGFGAWGPAAVCGALVQVMHGGLLALSDRRAALLTLPPPGPASSSSGSSDSGSGSVEVDRSSASSSSRSSSSGAAASALYARELAAVVAALHAFAMVRPSLVDAHCLRSLAPYLKGDALLQLAGSGQNEALLIRVCNTVELALPAAPPGAVDASLLRDIEGDLLALMSKGSPPVMRAAAACVGVLVGGVTGDDSRVRAFASKLYASLSGVKDARVSAIRRAAAAASAAAAAAASSAAGGAASAPPDDKVLWLRDISPTLAGGSVNPVHRGILSGLYGLTLLARFCDLDRNVEREAAAAGAGAAAAAVAIGDDDDDEAAGAAASTAKNKQRRSSKQPKRGSEGTSPPYKLTIAATPGGTVPVSSLSRVAGGSASSDLVTPVRQVTGGPAFAFSTGGKGQHLPLQHAGVASAPTQLVGTTAQHAAAAASTAQQQQQQQQQLPVGGGSLAAIHGVVSAYAHAALRLSRAASVRVASAAAPVRTSSGGSAGSGGGSASSSAAFDTAREVVRGYEAIALKALRGLGFLAARAPETLLSEGTSSALTAALSHPLPAVREAALLLLIELLGVPEERPASAIAMFAKAAADAGRLAIKRAAGYTCEPALIASAAGFGLRAALLRPPHGAMLGVSASSASATPAASAGPASSSSSAAHRLQDEGAGAGTSLSSPSVSVHSSHLADHDGVHASLVSGTVRAHYTAIRAALFDATEENSERHLNGGCSGARVRLAATQLLAQIVRHGVLDADACVSTLVALATDESGPITAVAGAQLLALAEKSPARVEAHAVAGVLESFRFQMIVLGEATARPPIPLDPINGLFAASPAAGGSPALPPPPPFLGRFYSACLSRTSRGRFAFLRSLVQRVIPDMLVALPGSSSSGVGVLASLVAGSDDASAAAAAAVPLQQPQQWAATGRRRSGGVRDAAAASNALVVDLSLARYLSETLMFLPYAKEEEVLTVVSYANRGVAVHADDLLSTLRKYVPPLPAHDGHPGVASTSSSPSPQKQREIPACGTPAYVALAAQTGYAVSLALLLQVKRYLKAAYDVRDARVRDFDPTASTTSSAGGAAASSSTAASAPAASAASGSAGGSATERERSIVLDARVAVSALSVLDAPPEGLEAALLAAPRPAGETDRRGNEHEKLTPVLLAAAAAMLEEQLELTADDFATKIHALSFAHKRRAVAVGRKAKAAAAGGGEAAVASSSSSSAAPAKKTKADAAKRKSTSTATGGKLAKRRSKGGNDGADSDADGDEGFARAKGAASAPFRASGRARKAVIYSEFTQAADDDGGEAELA